MTEGPWLPWAKPVWDERGTPVSPAYGDVYFSRSDGLAESHHVFIRGNDLPARLSSLTPGQTFVVAETGFGTGLNVQALMGVFLAHAPPHSRLHVFSVEKHPLHPDDIRKAAGYRAVPADLTARLLELYPAPLHGLHRRTTADGRITLSLYFGDVRDALDDTAFQADAWFLDGFSPSCNPDMWADEVLERIRTHTAPGGTLATFTAVGRIRRTLSALGFEVTKTAGFGHKRDMTRARLPGHPARHRPDHVVIVGSGIAGACLARHLALSGTRVTVLEKGDTVATGASGNPQGALYFKPGVEFSPHTALHATAYGYARHFYAHQTPEHWHPSGLLAMAHTEKESARQGRFLSRNHYGSWLTPVDQSEASELAGIRLRTGGLWFPGGGWLRPRQVVSGLLDHPGINVITHATVAELHNGTVLWHARDGSAHTLDADIIVLATGADTGAWLPPTPRPVLKPIRGQIINGTVRGWPVRTVLCAGGYLMPADGHQVTLGASFHPNSTSLEPSDADTRDILNQAADICTDMQSLTEKVLWTPRVSVRAAAPDYMPVVGRLADQIWLIGGLGSKGFMLAPLLSAHLADTLCDTVPALASDLARRVDIARFPGMEPIRERIFRPTHSEHSDTGSGECGSQNGRACL